MVKYDYALLRTFQIHQISTKSNTPVVNKNSDPNNQQKTQPYSHFLGIMKHSLSNGLANLFIFILE
jgi:hypothetical protein